MDFDGNLYDIEFTEDCSEEIRNIYKYISEKLIANDSAKMLMVKMRDTIMNLAESPRLYATINKVDKSKRRFRKIVIANYIILYTIDEVKRKIYISHMYFKRKNYLF